MNEVKLGIPTQISFSWQNISDKLSIWISWALPPQSTNKIDLGNAQSGVLGSPSWDYLEHFRPASANLCLGNWLGCRMGHCFWKLLFNDSEYRAGRNWDNFLTLSHYEASFWMGNSVSLSLNEWELASLPGGGGLAWENEVQVCCTLYQ